MCAGEEGKKGECGRLVPAREEGTVLRSGNYIVYECAGRGGYLGAPVNVH